MDSGDGWWKWHILVLFLTVITLLAWTGGSMIYCSKSYCIGDIVVAVGCEEVLAWARAHA